MSFYTYRGYEIVYNEKRHHGEQWEVVKDGTVLVTPLPSWEEAEKRVDERLMTPELRGS